MSKQNKQPLLQRPAVVGVLASLLSIVVGLVLGFVLLVLLNPGAAVGGMRAMLATGFSSMDKLGKVLYQAAPLMMCGLSVGFAFKTGLFNIGASGQYTMGAFFSLLCAIQFQLPWYVCLLAGAVGGAIWGVFPGLFKAYFNVNEVITAIMFNWIGMYLVNLLLANMPNMLASGWGASNSDRTAALSAANPGAILPKGPFAALFGNSSWINISIIITILFAILVWVILQKTTFGYELKACGLSRDAAQYAGINSKRNIVLSMVISGALSGIGGAIYFPLQNGENHPKGRKKIRPPLHFWQGNSILIFGQKEGGGSPMKSVNIKLNLMTDGAKFVQIVGAYPYDMDLRSGRHVVDAKSILGIFSLDWSKPVTMEIYSDDCDDLLAEIKPFLA